MSTHQTHVAVIGAGLAGLATAALLAKNGLTVDLFEKNEDLGGRCGLWERDGYLFDTGPSWYLMPEVFDKFFHDVGTSTGEQLDLTTLTPGYRVFAENHPVPVDVTSGHAEELFDSLEAGGGKKLRTYLDSASRTYKLALDHFLYTDFRAIGPFLDKKIVSRVGELPTLLGTSLNSFVTKRFSHPVLRQILGYHAVFLGTSPDRAPAMYHLMSHLDLVDGVKYPQGGFITIINAIEQVALDLGVTIHRGSPVTRIVTADARPTQSTHGLRGKAGERIAALTGKRTKHVIGLETERDGERTFHKADLVVGASDLHHLETQLLDPEEQSFPQSYWDKKDPGPGSVLVHLGVRGELPELTHHNLFFVKDWDANFDAIYGKNKHLPNPASLYVCKPSATDSTVAPEGHENVFILVPVPADPTIGSGGENGTGDPTVELAADAAIDQVATWAGIPDLRERIVLRKTVGPADFVNDVNAWSGGALGPAHTLAQSAMFRTTNRSKKIDGLWYAGGSTIPGIGLPMCLISADITARGILHEVQPGTPAPTGPTFPLPRDTASA